MSIKTFTGLNRLKQLISMIVLCVLSTSAFSAVILQYHHVSNDTPRITSIDPELFRQHLEYIEEEGFRVWPLPKLMEALQEDAEIPDKVVVITFDDAYTSIYDNALPLLKDRNWPFTVFVSTGPVNSGIKGFMTWEQIRKLTEHRGTIGNHTESHAHLVRRKPDESGSQWLERVRSEINEAQQDIRKHTGQDHRILAYPYGEYTADIQELVSSMGFTGFGQHSGAVSSKHDRTTLPRFPMNNIYGKFEQFKTKVASLPLPARKVSPGNHVASSSEALRDGLTITFYPIEGIDGAPANLACYLSFGGQAPLKVSHSKDGSFSARIPSIDSLPVGRSRVNCTLPSPRLKGRFHWFSHYWMTPNPDGSWYAEP